MKRFAEYYGIEFLHTDPVRALSEDGGMGAFYMLGAIYYNSVLFFGAFLPKLMQHGRIIPKTKTSWH